MSIETITAGQRDWVKTLNDNFTELGKQATEVDVVLGDGFTITKRKDFKNYDVKYES